MKKWTAKFISVKPTLKRGKSYKNTLDNGDKAQAKLKFPKELWLEISKTLTAAGWAEHEESVK